MGKTFRKNIKYCASTNNRSKKSAALSTATDEFHRGSNYQKKKVARHGRRAPARKGMPPAYAASARARQQQQVDRHSRQRQLVENNRKEERCEAAYRNVFEQRAPLNEQELAAITEWNTPLIVKAGSDTFQMNDNHTYTLAKDHYDSTPCLVRKIGDKFYCITVEMVELLRVLQPKRS